MTEKTDKDVSAEQTLRKLIAKATKRKNVNMTPTCTFKDLGVDSMSVVQILVALEEDLGIDINDKDLPAIHNIGAFIDYLQKKMDENKPTKRGRQPQAKESGW